ncbi:MAG: PAS domain-containing protein [Rhodobacter sp.]|nr:PAS domain-containing protein [Rhodobacter sp.]
MVFSFLGGRRDGGETPAARPRGPAEVRAYWEGLRQDGAIPTRADLDPRGMANVLDQVFVAERIGTGLVRLRIAGTGLTEIAGLDMKGLPLSALFLPEARLRLAAVLERVFTLPEVAELHLEGERTIGRPALAARLLLLPLHSNNGTRDLILGCLAAAGEIGRAPRRFDIARAVEERLVVPQAPVETVPIIAAFAESAAPPPRPVPGKPKLRLVHSVD